MARLIVDSTCEIADVIGAFCSDKFWQIDQVSDSHDDVYVVGRTLLSNNLDFWKSRIDQGQRVVFSNPFEGSETLRSHIQVYGLADHFQQGRMLLVGGGDMDPAWPVLRYDLFMTKLHEYYENHTEILLADGIFDLLDKPKKFLFLNGRGRRHRKWMVERLDHAGLLDSAIWSWLDPNSRFGRGLELCMDGQDLMSRPRDIHMLDDCYEVTRYLGNLSAAQQQSNLAKYQLFNQEWGEIYLRAAPYVDSYFSVVTETVFDYPYSFRTEKIWKPIAIGHPWIAVANRGFYRDMRDLGFRTFHGIIDESFDLIDNDQDRIERIFQVIDDLCHRDLKEFLQQCQDICKYNQQHMIERAARERKEFPDRFFQFLKQHQWMI